MPKKPLSFALQSSNRATTGIGIRVYLNKFEIETLISGLGWLQHESEDQFEAEYVAATIICKKLHNLLEASIDAQ